MPGAKRKVDEDTWLTTQSKKFKCGQLLANVYATTLAQLRLGARNFFKASSQGSPRREDGSSPFHSPPASPLVRDVLSHEDGVSGALGPVPSSGVKACPSCQGQRKEAESCYFCEKRMCHVNPCEGCGEGYCGDCSITKYDNPSGETYSCYNCLC